MVISLLRASEIGDVLEIKNIRTSIIDFDENEKGVVYYAYPLVVSKKYYFLPK